MWGRPTKSARLVVVLPSENIVFTHVWLEGAEYYRVDGLSDLGVKIRLLQQSYNYPGTHMKIVSPTSFLILTPHIFGDFTISPWWQLQFQGPVTVSKQAGCFMFISRFSVCNTHVKNSICSIAHLHTCLHAAPVGHLNPTVVFFCKQTRKVTTNWHF